MDQDKIEQMQQLATSFGAKFEGEMTVAWYRTCQNIGQDLGEASEDNPLFLLFLGGACEGALMMQQNIKRLNESAEQVLDEKNEQ